MVNQIFEYCVGALHFLAGLTGTSYQEINVLIFCLLIPLIIIVQFIWIWILINGRRIRY